VILEHLVVGRAEQHPVADQRRPLGQHRFLQVSEPG
jgi:hypothetical protein